MMTFNNFFVAVLDPTISMNDRQIVVSIDFSDVNPNILFTPAVFSTIC